MPTSSRGRIAARRVWKRFRADRRRPSVRDRVELLRDRSRGESPSGWRWALRDVDFTVAPGESIGLVGANGSGKSTLLKILTQVMYPYAGAVEVGGRTGALIEVRAGIHPELTGRENVYLYGSLLGLRRREVTRRFDEIVEFAQLANAIERPVKFYSSGMQMRLGFAVAAFLQPDVLLVDEVLAVGDAAFQQRCLDRMRQVLAEGTTLVLVSHDLPAIEAMCGRGLWLDDGVLRADGPIRDVLGGYRRSIERPSDGAAAAVGPVRVRIDAAARPGGGLPATCGPLQVTLGLVPQRECAGRLYLGISDGTAAPTFVVSTYVDLPGGGGTVTCTIDALPLPRGHYALWTGMVERDTDADLVPWHPIGAFDVIGPDLDPTPRAVVRPSPVHVQARWVGDGVT